MEIRSRMATWDSGPTGMATASTRLRKAEYRALRNELAYHGITVHELIRHLIAAWVISTGARWPKSSTMINDLRVYGQAVTHYMGKL